MPTPSERDSLPEHPDPDLAEYRPVSGWAMVALLVGLASAGALAHPLLWCVPLAGVAISFAALRRIERSEGKVLGRKAALIGLAFSVIYGVAAPVRMVSRDHWLGTRAERLADEFLDLVRLRQTDRAFNFMLQSVEKSSPRHPPPPGEKADAEPAPASQQNSFFAGPPVSTLLALGQQARVERLRTDVLLVEGGRQSVAVLYEVHYPDEHRLNPLEVLIYADQVFDASGQERWWISSVSTPPPPRLSP